MTSTFIRRRQTFKTTTPTKQEAARTENHQNSRNKASWRPPSKPDWHTERREKKLRKIYKHKKEIREIILNSIMVEEEEKDTDLRITEIG
jgi:hypothetical protein